MSWFRVTPDKSGAVTIGRYKEQLVREVAFPLPPLGEGGHYQAKLQRPHDEAPYPLASRVEGQTLIWLVSLADTSDPGEGLVEIRWDGPNGETWKSPQYAVRIAKGLADPKEAPEAWAGFLQQVNRDAGRAESAADNAAQTLKKLEDGIASGDFRGEKGEKGEKGDPGPQGPQGEPGPAGDTTAAAAAAAAAKEAAQEAQKAAEASAGSAAQAAESVGGLADDLEATQKDIAKMKRAIQFQAELSKGQTWDFETDDSVAYSRTVPSGAKAGAVMEWGGKTVGWNQRISPESKQSIGYNDTTHKYYFADWSDTGTKYVTKDIPIVSGHKYYIFASDSVRYSIFYVYGSGLKGIFGGGAKPETKITDIMTANNTGTVNVYFNRYQASAENASYFEGIIVFIDLTLMFGPGNEPTDTSDPRIAQIEAYAAAHPEYNAGELVSALVDEVDVMGANILRPSGTFPYSSRGITAVRNQDSTITINGTSTGYPFFEVGRLQLKKGTTYFIPRASRIMQSEDGNRIVVYNNNNGFTPNKDYPDVFLEYTIAPNETFSNTVVALIVSVGSLRDYSPYTLTTLPIPDAVKQLPGYGWSAGSVANTVERTEDGWQYVQRVEKTELTASISMDNQFGNYDNETSFMICVDGFLPKISAYAKNVRSLSCNTLTCPPENVQNSQTKQVYALASHSNVKYSANLYIRLPYSIKFGLSKDSTSKEKVNASREWFAAHKTITYYEQETVTTDITALMGDSLAPFSVEAGGSITFHHPKADEGFAIDVPAKIQYITKLSEVSANG